MDPQKIKSLLHHAHKQFAAQKFRPAQIGRQNTLMQNQDIRKDHIHWVEDWSESPLKELLEFYEQSQQKLREEFFLPIKRFEAHFARYDVGAFYKRHIDQHQNHPYRLISSALYLNDVSKGGELVLYDPSDYDSDDTGKEKVLVTIQPKAGLQVFFDSRIPHEVRPTFSERWSLAGWFRSDIP